MRRRDLLATGLAAGASVSAAQSQTQPARWENPVRKTLKEGKPVVGATITVPSADIAARMATLGFDFLWIEMEHSGITLESARNMILATRGLPCVPFIRVPFNEIWLAKRALDIGAIGVLFPFTSTPELARAAVHACKYPPAGGRGSGGGLASLRWPAPEGYADFADRNAMVIVIIEEKQAVENIEEIAAVPGVDVLFIGANDLSFSYGYRGRKDAEDFKAGVRRVVEAGKKHGIPVGWPAAAAEIPDLMKQGFSFFQGASELAMLGPGAKAYTDATGKKSADAGDRPLY
jgi:2-keto-3-deoxy-L-rhamnonate aldolase RhmA